MSRGDAGRRARRRERASRALALGLALALALLGAGCHGVPTGPVARPELYPDRTSPEAAWSTFLWAWREGDVDVLEAVLGGWMRWRLTQELEANPRPDVGEWYRRDATDLAVVEAAWTHRGEAIAYLHVVLACAARPRAELDFALASMPNGWVVTGQRLVR